MAYTYGAELLSNTDFETDVNGWYIDPADGSIEQDEEDSRQVMKAVAGTSGSLFSSAIYSTPAISYTGDAHYVVEMDVKVPTVGVRFGVALRTAAGDSGVETRQFVSDGNWMHIREEFVAQSTYASGYIALLIGGHDGEEEFYFDTVSLRQVIYDDTVYPSNTAYITLAPNLASSVTLSGNRFKRVIVTSVDIDSPVYVRADGIDAERGAFGTYVVVGTGFTAEMPVVPASTVTVSAVSESYGIVNIAAYENFKHIV